MIWWDLIEIRVGIKVFVNYFSEWFGYIVVNKLDMIFDLIGFLFRVKFLTFFRFSKCDFVLDVFGVFV